MRWLFVVLMFLTGTQVKAAVSSFGMGLSAPCIPVVTYQLWTKSFLLRAHVGTIFVAGSAGMDIGMPVSSEGDFRQYIALSGDVNGFREGNAWGGLGPKYGIQYKNFYADAGIVFGPSNYSPARLFELDGSAAAYPSFHAGFIFPL